MIFLEALPPVVSLSEVVDTLSGSAGWVGTGLLGSVLAWLLFVHLPAKDKQLKEREDAKDKQLKELVDSKDVQFINMLATRDDLVQKLSKSYTEDVATMLHRSDQESKEKRQDFRDSLQMLVGHHEKQIGVLTNILQKELEESISAMIDMRKTLEELREYLIRNTKQ